MMLSYQFSLSLPLMPTPGFFITLFRFMLYWLTPLHYFSFAAGFFE